jgi:bifunctional non-homologous end joining protein LigD
MVADASEVTVGRHHLTLSNLDKVLYPAVGFTKAQVIDYYVRIAPVLLPHLRGRPLTLKRYPNGVEGGHFYEKRCPVHRPSWVHTAALFSARKQASVEYCVVDDLATLVWAANLADLELHPSLARAPHLEQPTAVVFDLDPGAPANLVQCCRVGLRLRDLFDRLGLRSFAKTSGGKGLQVYVPLHTSVTYERTKPFAHSIASGLERKMPREITSRMTKSLRPGKVFVDWSQNDRHKTTVCVYSLRAQPRPTVSTPVTWDEVEEVARRRDPRLLVFAPEDVQHRVEEHGDLFAPVEKIRQRLPDL